MKIYLNGTDAVKDLHEKGFTNDFQFSGTDLMWLQEKILIRVGEFAIVECYCIMGSESIMDEVVVYGIIVPYYNVKGVLINHSKNYAC